MFKKFIDQRTHHDRRDGIDAFRAWEAQMGINAEDFPFEVKTGQFTRKGATIWLRVMSWGFYQAADWHYYVFISYRTSDGRYTCAYHFDVDENGLPVGKPRKHEWTY